MTPGRPDRGVDHETDWGECPPPTAILSRRSRVGVSPLHIECKGMSPETTSKEAAMSVSHLTVVFPSTREFSVFCAMLTPWVDTCESDVSGVVRADVLMYGPRDSARMKIYNAGGNEVTDAPVTDEEEVEVLVCPRCGGLSYYPTHERLVNCADCEEDFVICAMFDDEPTEDIEFDADDYGDEWVDSMADEIMGRHSDDMHCDECGELIDNASDGCQSAGAGRGCRGWGCPVPVCDIDHIL